MARAFCVPAVFFLFSAFVLLFIVSVSLPYLTAMDITRVHSDGVSLYSGNNTMTQLRVGIKLISIIRAYCFDLPDGNRVCSSTGNVLYNNANNNSITIGSSWTRGLAVHPVATGVSFIALLLATSQHITITLFASLVAFIAALITFIAFIIDIALLAYVRNQMENLGLSGVVLDPATKLLQLGFWLTFTSLILLLLGGCTVCFGRRRDRMANATSTLSSPKEGFFSRFKRN
ncbi:hypothetical protein ID866_6631 [Astraeus odoratus]|nr:hypothetical protein ID866_6631 [Astraeus odoratus]